MIFIGSIVLLMVNPIDWMYKPFRFELLYCLYQNIIAPFGLVRFKEFFLGDILTSMVKPLIDVYCIGCLLRADQ